LGDLPQNLVKGFRAFRAYHVQFPAGNRGHYKQSGKPRANNFCCLFHFVSLLLLKSAHPQERAFCQWTCSTTRLVVEQVLQKALLFAIFSGSYAETEVSE
jgi:hypothetical protein